MINQKLRSCLAVFSAATIIFSSSAYAQSTEKTLTAFYNDIKIVVDGEKIVPMDVNGEIAEPFIIDGTTYLPVRAVASALGKQVSWDGETNTVIITSSEAGTEGNNNGTEETYTGRKNQEELHVFYNDIKIVIDGKEIKLKDVNGNIVQPFILNGTTYLPVRAVANALGKNVDWDGDTNTVYIGKTPVSEDVFRPDADSLREFSELPLAMAGNTPIKGSYYNLLLTQNCSLQIFPYYCDNYSPDATLQTLTLQGIPAAKYFTELFTPELRTVFSVYDYALKNGFFNRSDMQDALNSAFQSYRLAFSSDDEYMAFLNENCISAVDYETFIKASSAYSLYADDLYSRYMSSGYTNEELLKLYSNDYVKVKHILVEDPETADLVISELKKGTDMDALIEKYNTDPGQGIEGYTFTYGEMVKEFEDAAFNLKENTFTKAPVETSYGYHIIYRYPIEMSWIEQNSSTLQSEACAKAVDSAIDNIVNSSSFSLTENYTRYITTIK